ncbi:RNA polymerase sigma factor [Fulvivirga sp.]|uniref:RNA polymerase sigma factor n=1 Tax=Fulvivirga sp. TaxID=1931237 RepID=UPI0032EEA5A1
MNKNENDFLEIIDDNQKIIHNVCRIYTDTTTDHHDLFQEILLQLWKGYHNFKGDAKVSTWIYRVSLYTAITYIKKVMKERKLNEEVLMESTYEQKDEDTYEELLQGAIERLNENQKALITLYLDDKSYKEMSSILGISESNVGARINRLKSKLKDIFNQSKDGY